MSSRLSSKPIAIRMYISNRLRIGLLIIIHGELWLCSHVSQGGCQEEGCKKHPERGTFYRKIAWFG